jgi:hypothetical protein
MFTTELNSLTRKELLGLVSQELASRKDTVRVMKANPRLKSKTLGFKRMEIPFVKKDENVINLKQIDRQVEDTCPETIRERCGDVLTNEKYNDSYNYLKDLAIRARKGIFMRDRVKKPSTLKVTHSLFDADKEDLVRKFSKRRTTVNENSNLSFVKLIPCLKESGKISGIYNNGGFKIELIRCEKY